MLTHALVTNPPPPPETLPPPPPPFWREFWILFALGFLAYAIAISITHFSLTTLTLYLALQESASGQTLTVIAAIEYAIALAFTVGLGLAAARVLGLGAPIIEAALRRSPILRQLASILLPALAVGILIGLWTIFLHAPVFRSHHQHESQPSLEEYNRFVHSPAGEKFLQLRDRLDRGYHGYRVTPTVEMALAATGAVDNSLFSQLFFLSCTLWVLIKLTHAPPLQPSPKLIWIAIVLAYALPSLLGHAESYLGAQIFAPYQAALHIQSEPFWPFALRGLALWLAPALLLGWLYLRRGLEACILASFIGTLISEAHFIFTLFNFH